MARSPRGTPASNPWSKERLAELATDPGVVRLVELLAKIQSGTATAAERAEFDDRTAWVYELPPNLLSEQHRPGSAD